MTKFVEADEHVKLSEQLEENVGPIVLINRFNVKPEEADQLLKAWEKDATYFKSQPGFISTQLHRGIGGSGVFVNYAVWESTALFKKALSNIDIQELLSDYPASAVVSPHLFKKVAVPGICVD
ncbi:MAG TPA: antibiotic biosynthesis monooxygenase family protein [Nitrososphaeraceae archaeon]|jgi:quinol monooxygenase YgiN|nr:antibiotic biosynthesis monooxygenase family protein [Nitrososphaeraceae archaeon]